MEGSISIEYLTQGTYFVKLTIQNTSYTILKNNFQSFGLYL